MDYQVEYEKWLASPAIDEATRKELLAMDEKTKSDAFYKNIEFGTAGMRGLLGAGNNRLNYYTVKKATIGFGLFLMETIPGAKEKGVAISHDNRHFSREFTLFSAKILNEMGIKAYIFDDLRATPELSYAVRYAGCAGGIMITASHNSKEWNGYKVYDETGCQLVPGKIKRLLEILDELPDYLSVEVPTAEFKGETITFDSKIDDDYVEAVKSLQVHPELDKKGFKVVYSPQHGASYENAMRVFTELGYEIIPVKEQCTHDPDFSGTITPNPEADKAWVKVMEYIEREDAQFGVMTDPDGDRCGLAYKTSKGTYAHFTGNQSAALLCDYLCSQKKALGQLPENGVVYDTIVSSSLARDVAASYGLKSESFLTGFKFIGDRIAYYEKLGVGPKFFFGYEESYGCLVGDFVRDKDGIQAILLYTEMALWHYRNGTPLDVAYEELQKKYGYHDAYSVPLAFEGMEGNAKMKALMAKAHGEPLKEIAGIKVAEVQDYLTDIATLADGSTRKIVNLPPSDVVKYVLEDGSTITIRPSGTEPKVKFYMEAVGKTPNGLKEKNEAMYAYLAKYLGI